MHNVSRLIKYCIVLVILTSACSEKHEISPQTNEKVVIELLKASSALKSYKGKLDEQAKLIKKRIDKHGLEEVSMKLIEAVENEDLDRLAYWSGFISGVEFISFENEKNWIFKSFKKEINNFDSFSVDVQNALLAEALTGGSSNFSNVIHRGCEIRLAICDRVTIHNFYNSSASCSGVRLVYPEWPSCQAGANSRLASSLLSCTAEYNDCAK
ncbi:MAG: hypothetical protein RIM99_00465 [Cyclobacteriaceae bacterium]